MTVGELISVLQGMPQDAVVIYNCCSDYAEMDNDQVTLVRAEDQKIVYREENGYLDYKPEWFMTEDEYERWIDKEIERANKPLVDRGEKPAYDRRYFLGLNKYRREVPKFVTVCHFPGN